MRIEALVASGVPRDAAEAEAIRRFGSLDEVRPQLLAAALPRGDADHVRAVRCAAQAVATRSASFVAHPAFSAALALVRARHRRERDDVRDPSTDCCSAARLHGGRRSGRPRVPPLPDLDGSEHRRQHQATSAMPSFVRSRAPSKRRPRSFRTRTASSAPAPRRRRSPWGS